MIPSHIHFASTNAGKIKEVQAILGIPITPVDIELDELQTLDFKVVVEHKARQAYDKLKHPVLVEDSGVIFHALGQLPGVFTKWFLTELTPSGMATLLTGHTDTRATAVSYVSYFDGTTMYTAHGETVGHIVSPRGTQGFGWNAIFEVDSHKLTFAEMDPETKNSLSMRKDALQNLLTLLSD